MNHVAQYYAQWDISSLILGDDEENIPSDDTDVGLYCEYRSTSTINRSKNQGYLSLDTLGLSNADFF